MPDKHSPELEKRIAREMANAQPPPPLRATEHPMFGWDWIDQGPQRILVITLTNTEQLLFPFSKEKAIEMCKKGIAPSLDLPGNGHH